MCPSPRPPCCDLPWSGGPPFSSPSLTPLLRLAWLFVNPPAAGENPPRPLLRVPPLLLTRIQPCSSSLLRPPSFATTRRGGRVALTRPWVPWSRRILHARERPGLAGDPSTAPADQAPWPALLAPHAEMVLRTGAPPVSVKRPLCALGLPCRARRPEWRQRCQQSLGVPVLWSSGSNEDGPLKTQVSLKGTWMGFPVSSLGLLTVPAQLPEERGGGKEPCQAARACPAAGPGSPVSARPG